MLKTDHLNDAQALLDQRGGGVAPSRRRALTLGLGMGYAAATLPVMAQTAIKTPTDGLSVGEVSIDVAGFKMPAFRAQPAGKTGTLDGPQFHDALRDTGMGLAVGV